MICKNKFVAKLVKEHVHQCIRHVTLSVIEIIEQKLVCTEGLSESLYFIHSLIEFLIDTLIKSAHNGK